MVLFLVTPFSGIEKVNAFIHLSLGNCPIDVNADFVITVFHEVESIQVSYLIFLISYDNFVNVWFGLSQIAQGNISALRFV